MYILIDCINELFNLVKSILMTTPPHGININFSMLEKHPNILIKDSIGIILVSGTLLHIHSANF